MNHHAYVCYGEGGEKRARALGKTLGLEEGNQDLILLSYTLFSVDDARSLQDVVRTTSLSGKKLIILSISRIFHEAQNALLKTFEEPPEGTTLVLCVPSEGMLLETLRSRLIALETKEEKEEVGELFLKGNATARAKIIETILSKAKKDDGEEKQEARRDALLLAQSLVRAVGAKEKTKEVLQYLKDLHTFIPILHERSAPLKPILEHLLIAAPRV